MGRFGCKMKAIVLPVKLASYFQCFVVSILKKLGRLYANFLFTNVTYRSPYEGLSE